MTLTEESPPRRGRPRDPATIQRDRLVLRSIAAAPEGLTREEIHRETDLTEVRVYQSLRRLKRRNAVHRERDSTRHVWHATQVGRDHARLEATP